MGSGLVTIDQYDVSDKLLFTVKSTLFTLHRPKKGVILDVFGGASGEWPV